MSQEPLGLFDTPPNRLEVQLGLLCVGLLSAAALIVLPVVDTRLPEVPAFIPTINAINFVGELIIATLLFAQASVFRSPALNVLASGFAFIALLLVAYVLTFPGVFAQHGLLGAGTNTAAWLIVVRRLAFPIMILLYLVYRAKDGDPGPGSDPSTVRPIVGLLIAIALAAAMIVTTTLGHDLLPPMFIDRSEGVYSNLLAVNLVTITVISGVAALLFVRRKSLLDMWLLVALAGWLIQSLFNIALTARFTLGWYSLQFIMLFASLFVLIALIAESNRLYARLVLTTAARKRERDAWLMSMEAVAASITHEVRQPLAAISLNALAGQNWLALDRPNIDKARESMDAVMDSARRSSEIMKSVRSIFTRSPNPALEFDLNELIRESVRLMHNELNNAKVALSVSFDEQLGPVRGNRVQIQQVLVNLLTNAIESLVAARRRRRRISINTAAQEDQKVLLEISDNGAGIAAETIPHLFKAFHTTKTAGTGIGLSLSRTIVEEHGGVIWPSQRPKGGATFHVQLPCTKTA